MDVPDLPSSERGAAPRRKKKPHRSAHLYARACDSRRRNRCARARRRNSRRREARQVYVHKDLEPLAETWVRNYHPALTVLEKISSINLELIRRKEAYPNR